LTVRAEGRYSKKIPAHQSLTTHDSPGGHNPTPQNAGILKKNLHKKPASRIVPGGESTMYFPQPSSYIPKKTYDHPVQS